METTDLTLMSPTVATIASSLSAMSSSTQVPRVPLELVQEIIGQLRGEAKTLKACTGVSRQWFDSARRYLFQTVAVRVPLDADTHHGFTEFLAFLRANSYQGHHIQSLYLSTTNAWNTDRRISLCKHDLQEILLATPNLRRLVLLIRSRGCNKQCNGRSLVSRPIHLKTLLFDVGSHEDDLGDVLDILRLFGEVDLLNVPSVRPTAKMNNLKDQIRALGPPEHLRIRALTTVYDGGTGGLFLEIAQLTPSVDTISALGAQSLWDARHATLDELLKKNKPRLENLFLDLSTVFADPENDEDMRDWNWLSLESFPCLESIGFMFLVTDIFPGWDEEELDEACYFEEADGYMDMLFAASSSTTVRSITIKVEFELTHKDEEDCGSVLARKVDLEAMAAALDKFVNLETITFGFVDGQQVLDACRPVLQETLTDFDIRGGLRFETMDVGCVPPRIQVDQ
ncbi:hypothetical protein EIP91_011277 [Steccherinum ochraceum]|uniref:F-box domain-containing protein n=1 Tax=Steccherinum ochraceum TaxID=92696 RepID=A0A4R0R884_9APHY|nr:hypothetical protein EIP91_011277 [Steccherinum ochraceum]